MALNFLKLEELPDDERPKRAIWLESDLMREHFRKVEQIRERKMKGEKDDWEDWKIDGPSQRNVLLDQYR